MVIWLKVPTRVSFWPTVKELKKFQPFYPGQPEPQEGLSGKGGWPGFIHDPTVFM